MHGSEKQTLHGCSWSADAASGERRAPETASPQHRSSRPAPALPPSTDSRARAGGARGRRRPWKCRQGAPGRPEPSQLLSASSRARRPLASFTPAWPAASAAAVFQARTLVTVTFRQPLESGLGRGTGTGRGTHETDTTAAGLQLALTRS